MTSAGRMRIRLRLILVIAVVSILTATAPWLLGAAEPTGYRPVAFAIRGARVVAAADHTIENGTVVVRQGRIESVGPADKVAVPFDAETIDGTGLVVYPGFVDLYTTIGQASDAVRSRTGAGRAVDYNGNVLAHTPEDNRTGLTPEFDVASVLELSESQAEAHRKLGFTSLLSAPAGAIATGQSALVSTSGLPRREAIVRSSVALHINVRPPFEPAPAPRSDDDHAAPRIRVRTTGRYPSVLMGAVAHLRQAMLDAEYQHALQADAGKGAPRAAFDPALQALYAARTKTLPVWWEANTRDEIHRVLDLAEEFGTTAVIVGGREAGKVVDRLKALDVPVVLRLDFGDEPKVPTEAEYRKRDLADRAEPYRVLQARAARWKELAGTAQALAKAGVRFALATDGLTKLEQFPAQLHKALAAGLAPSAAVDALTRRAAEIAGLGESLGTIEPGKLGHLVVMSAPLSDEHASVRYVLVDGQRFEVEKPSSAERPASSKKNEPETKAAPAPASTTRAETTKPAAASKGEAARPPATSTTKAEATTPATAKSDTSKPAPSTAKTETTKTTATATKAEAKPEAAKSKSEEPKAREAAREPARSEPATAKTKAAAAPPARTIEDPAPPVAAATPPLDVAAELEENRRPKRSTGGNVLIKDATILTVAKEGTIPRGSILVQNGKIVAVGADLPVPAGVAVIDAAGLVAMPGIIDSHSHIAIQGGGNEWSLSVVPEVRIKDVITSDDPAIFRALAGGTTTARILHGSADTIGGQDAVIKLKHTLAGRDLIIRDAPQGVKFALGENVTRNPGRFPNTRMGVEATIERAFEEGRAYKAAWQAYEAEKAQGRPAVAPRRDLRLEAIARILDGSIKVHCHCYRSDEILMLLQVAARHGVRIQSLQHVLEGYKVAAEIAAHGASASTFSDWWAYKIEAYDAIPYNAALLTQAGVSVCIKSDSEELIRHLNLEAAKMVKYGGVSEGQALAMITLNPARELGLDKRLGSIEVGKDADIALFNAHPFDGFARCELALIDGEVYFERPGHEAKLTARPGDHVAMPAPPQAVRTRRLEIPARADGVYALVGATLHPVAAPDIAEGTLIIRDGKIASIGDGTLNVPAAAQTIDVHGFDIWPGLVDAGTKLGLYEINSLAETQDDADSAPIEPELRTSSALHPDSEIIPVARANGILTAYVQPGGGLIAGQGCVIDLDGWVPREMVLADPVALQVTIPREIPANPVPAASRGRNEGPDPRQKRKQDLERIREEFRRALAYDRVRTEAQAHQAVPPMPDPRLAALVPYAKGQKPVIFRADRRGEILDALKIAADLKLKAIISGGADAWKVADALKEAKVPVLVGGTLQLPTETTDPYDAPYSNPARLHAAGVTFAIRSNPQGPEQATASRNLPYEASFAVAFGLPEAEAVKAVTLTPAQILGVAEQVGSLEVGKRANLVITAGHILQPTTDVKAVFIRGKPFNPQSRHTRLYERYRQRLAEVRAGTAVLGIDTPPAPTAGPAPAATPTATEGSSGHN